MKPTEDLINEHNAIKIMLSIMTKIAENINAGKGVNTDDLEKIVEFLKTFADKCHHGKEENSLFPALVDAGIPNEGGPIGVMLHEHTLGRGFINDISTSSEKQRTGNSDAIKLIAEGLLNYSDLLRNHIQKEENVLFRMADKVLSSLVQEDIYRQFEKIEEEVVGHGVHEQFHALLNRLKSKYLN